MEGLRPLGIGELLDASIRIYKSRFKTLIYAVAIPIVPVLIFTSLVTWSSQPDQGTDAQTGLPTMDGGDVGLYLAGLLVSLLLSVIASSIATAACYRSISGAYVGDDPDWRESLRFARGRIGRVIGLTLLVGLLTVLGLPFCLVGVLVPVTFLSVAMPVLLVEGQGVWPSIQRSWRLVRGTGWRVLGIVLLGQILSIAFQLAISAPIAILFVVDSGPVVQQVVTAVVSIVASVLITPFGAAFRMALYVDLRVRKEGFDLVLWAQRLGADPSGGFPQQPGSQHAVPFGGPGYGGPGYGGPGYGGPPTGAAAVDWADAFPRYPHVPIAAPAPPGWVPPSLPPPPPPPGSGAGTGGSPPPATGWGPPPGDDDRT